MKSYIETNLQPCIESSDSDLQAKKNSFQKKLEKKFQYEARKTRSVQMKTLSELYQYIECPIFLKENQKIIQL